MDNNTLFWILSAACVLLLELSSPGLFFFLSFCVGSLGAAGAAYGAVSFAFQLLVFCVLSLIAFISLRRWVLRHQSGGYRTNLYALPGSMGLVINEITPTQAGRIKIGGEIWSARTFGSHILPVHTRVEILKVQGAHLIVQRAKEL